LHIDLSGEQAMPEAMSIVAGQDGGIGAGPHGVLKVQAPPVHVAVGRQSGRGSLP
jgi:hypothetical protein